MPLEVDIAIIGAGVVGLAVAAELAREGRGVFVLEKNRTFGLEASSRNSQVIHAGIYYPEGSLKARLCIEGNHLLYELCEKHGVDCRRTGKIIVAVDEGETGELEELYQRGCRNGAEDLGLLSRRELEELEPQVAGVAALFSPSSGILDCHSLMRLFYTQARERGAGFVFNTEVTAVEKVGAGYEVQIRDREGVSSFVAGILINSAGLNSDRIAELSGIDPARAGYKLHYCKGEYFSFSSSKAPPVRRLVYPVPEQAGVGIHVTVGIDGRVRLGPSARYVENLDYRVDEAQRVAFYESVRRFLPLIELEDLEPEFAGIRSKLQAPGEAFRDFVIAREEKRGLPGLINLIGIESPGLTAAPAIARYVAGMVKELY